MAIFKKRLRPVFFVFRRGFMDNLFNRDTNVKDANTFLLIKELMLRKDENSDSLFKINLIKSTEDDLFFGGIYSNQLLSLNCYLEMYPQEMDFILGF
jgi:hypothetical protein